MAQVTIANVTLVKNDVTVLDDVSVDVREGELLAILGPSGAGKTSLLRVVAGLDTPTSGSVLIDGVDVTELAPKDRDVAMVFQEAVIFPNLDVGGNVAFPLRLRRRPAEEIATRVGAETRALHIENLLQRRAGQLSAGEKHLVQIARSLVRAPRLFLMDEPLARIDAGTRERMRGELKMMQRGYGVTTLYVTNDPREAMAMADRILVIVAGRTVQIGSPDDLYRRPVSMTVAKLTGEVNVVEVTVETTPHGAYQLVVGELCEQVWATTLERYVGATVELAIRPEAVRWPEEGGTEARVKDVVNYGSHLLVECVGDGFSIWARTADMSHTVGDTVRISLADHTVFDSATRRVVARATP